MAGPALRLEIGKDPGLPHLQTFLLFYRSEPTRYRLTFIFQLLEFQCRKGALLILFHLLLPPDQCWYLLLKQLHLFPVIILCGQGCKKMETHFSNLFALLKILWILLLVWKLSNVNQRFVQLYSLWLVDWIMNMRNTFNESPIFTYCWQNLMCLFLVC